MGVGHDHGVGGCFGVERWGGVGGQRGHVVGLMGDLTVSTSGGVFTGRVLLCSPVVGGRSIKIRSTQWK